ncbi:MAG: hypothetical protein PHE17_05315 [Thiothrix sp.]|uniref:hypothetical protein n=1 Tax=Thiothrix sp. TaxID=1032 RepID=UPI00260D2C23|nr:hypothetical protein [Thiothrix sp.]MDD5392421.1 hypothetical protein [Thiothrix sp.]
MSAIVINNTSLEPIEYRGERVLTFKMVDAVHAEKQANGLDTDSTYSKAGVSKSKTSFTRNRAHFVLDEDYFHAPMKDARALTGVHAPNGLTVLTESGYLMLVKTFTDDLAWKIQKQLVRSYFRARGEVVPTQQEIALHQPEVIQPQSADIAQMTNAIMAMTTGITSAMGQMAASISQLAQSMHQKPEASLPRVEAPYAIGEHDVIVMDARNMNPAMQELHKVILSCGGASRLAALIGLKRQDIYGWQRRGRVPAHYITDVKRQFPWVSVEALLSFKSPKSEA